MFIFNKKPKKLSKKELILRQIKDRPKTLSEDEKLDRRHKKVMVQNEALKCVRLIDDVKQGLILVEQFMLENRSFAARASAKVANHPLFDPENQNPFCRNVQYKVCVFLEEYTKSSLNCAPPLENIIFDMAADGDLSKLISFFDDQTEEIYRSMRLICKQIESSYE